MKLVITLGTIASLLGGGLNRLRPSDCGPA
jgi:hypothetical protein